MRFHTLLLCCLATAVLCSVTFAGDKKKDAKPTTFSGTIVKARENTLVFDATAANGPDVRRIYYVNKDTTVTVDGKPGSFDDLFQGMQVTVTPKNKNIAKSIDATSPPKKGW